MKNNYHEELRQKVSSICSAFEATENSPIDCTKPEYLHIDGLSKIGKSQILSVFQDYEGIVWITSDCADEPIELDYIPTDSIKEILDWLEKNLSIKAFGPLINNN